MRRLLSKILLQVPPRNRAYSVLFILISCLMVWNGYMTLKGHGQDLNAQGLFLGLALFAAGLQLVMDGVAYALPDYRHQAKLRLRILTLSLALATLTLVGVSCAVPGPYGR